MKTACTKFDTKESIEVQEENYVHKSSNLIKSGMELLLVNPMQGTTQRKIYGTMLSKESPKFSYPPTYNGFVPSTMSTPNITALSSKYLRKVYQPNSSSHTRDQGLFPVTFIAFKMKLHKSNATMHMNNKRCTISLLHWHIQHQTTNVYPHKMRLSHEDPPPSRHP